MTADEPLNDAEKAALVVSHLVKAMEAQGVSWTHIQNALLLNAAAAALANRCPSAAAYAEVSAAAFARMVTVYPMEFNYRRYPGQKTEPPRCQCCERGDMWNGFGSDGPLTFRCPTSCPCHD
jgi:hypothetical protein